MPRRGRTTEVITGGNLVHTQGELKGFEQPRVDEIETWATKYDAKRALINGLEGELENIGLKLREAVHANEDQVDHQMDAKDGPLLVYKRGDINVVVKRGKEKVNVKVGEKSTVPDEGDEGDDE